MLLSNATLGIIKEILVVIILLASIPVIKNFIIPKIEKNRYIAGSKIGAEAAKSGVKSKKWAETAGLFAAALDSRIKGTVSVYGFTPMRLCGNNQDIEGIKAYSHLHGLLPRLGFFTGNESIIPCDFHEVLSSIAPRKLLVISPQLDRDANINDVSACIKNVQGIYELYGNEENLMFLKPYYYGHFFSNRQKEVIDWFKIL